MSQTDELARVKARIRALTEKTVARGCTEAEAMAAAEMAGRLLERYALSMDEIEVREARCVQVEVTSGGRRRRPVDGCVPAIARFCDCKVWLARGDAATGAPARYIFFGFETDTALAAYLFAVVDRAIATETTGFRRARPDLRAARLRMATGSFQQGMAARVADRLARLHAEREAMVRTQRSTGTALILARHQVVEEAFRATGVRLVSASRIGHRHGEAFHQGWQAGARVNLTRPVGGEARALLE
jgi:hypothetical protein